MRSVAVSFVLSSLCSIILSGCSFQTYRPDELGASGTGLTNCAITKFDGVIGGDTVDLFKPSDMRSYLSKVVRYGYPKPYILPSGSEVRLISLSSGWDSVIGRYIKAKASVSDMGGRVYYFRLYEFINNSLSKKDFTRFVDDVFAPCKQK